MPNLPIQFRKASEAAIASYSYTDIAEGTGIVVFYGAAHREETTTAYLLTTATPYSNGIVTATTTASGSFDLDFDVEFNNPQLIKGNAYVSATIGGRTGTASTVIKFTAKIRKWDGSSETEIASAISETLSIPSGTTKSKTMLVKIPITTLQHFKAGETLRLTMLVEFTSAQVVIAHAIGHDPMNRAYTYFGTDTTKLLFHCPFVLDL